MGSREADGHVQSGQESEGEEESESENVMNQFKNSMDLEEALNQANLNTITFFDGKYEKAVVDCMNKSSLHMIFALGTASFKSLQAAAFDGDKTLFEEALECIKYASKYANVFRKKRRGIFSSTDFNSYSDEEAFAELVHAILSGFSASMTFLSDKSFFGAVNAATKGSLAHSSFKKCLKILDNKSNWKSEDLRMNFESGSRTGMGIFDLLISSFPKDMSTQMKLFGLTSDRGSALNHLIKANQLPDGLMYYVSCAAMAMYQGYIQYSYEVGEADTSFFENNEQIWMEKIPNSIFTRIWIATWKQITGQVDESIDYYRQGLTNNELLNTLNTISRRGIVICCIMKQDWNQALECLQILRNEMESLAEFTYLYAIVLFMKMDSQRGELNEDEQKDVKSEMIDCFKRVAKINQESGLRMGFHGKLVLSNAERYAKDPNRMILPILDLCYVWNIFPMMAGNENLINGYLNLINGKIDQHNLKKEDSSRTNVEKFSYLTFTRGTILRHQGSLDESAKCFQDVLSCKKSILNQLHKHLLPQSCFELGMVHRKLGNCEEAKEWFKKARNDYKNYATFDMIQHRTESLLKEFKVNKSTTPDGDISMSMSKCITLIALLVVVICVLLKLFWI